LITIIVNNKNNYKGVYKMNPITSSNTVSPLTHYYTPGTEKSSAVIIDEAIELQNLASRVAEIAVSPSAIVNISPAAIKALEQAVNNL